MVIQPFMIFALARTGSTSFARILNCHPDIKCAHEPFNPDERKFMACKNITNNSQLSEAINRIYSTHNGIKHVWHPNGWPFTSNTELNKLILSHPRRILFLHRKNVLQRVVSSQISSQTKIWHINHPADTATLSTFHFNELDKEWISWHIHNEKKYLTDWKTYMLDHGISFLELYYEDLFSDEISITLKLQTLSKVYKFVGSAIEKIISWDEITELLNRSSKMSTPALYQRIPKIKEIESAFGSPHSGWLFK